MIPIPDPELIAERNAATESRGTSLFDTKLTTLVAADHMIDHLMELGDYNLKSKPHLLHTISDVIARLPSIRARDASINKREVLKIIYGLSPLLDKLDVDPEPLFRMLMAEDLATKAGLVRGTLPRNAALILSLLELGQCCGYG